MASLNEKFQAAVDIVQKLPKEGPISTSNDQKLRFYSLYKQATIGNVNTERPGFFSFIERAKWDSWKTVENMSEEDAKKTYIEELLKMIEEIREKVNMAEWLNGPNLDPSIKANMELLGVKTD